MNTGHRIAACALGLALVPAAFASGKQEPGAAQQRYNTERARCMNGQSNQDRATCLKEAGAALREARRNGLATDKGSLQGNATARCDNQPAADKADCIARIQGAGATSGSVEGGGLIRQTETTVPVK